MSDLLWQKDGVAVDARIMRFLAGEDVKSSRLSSQGYGETIPLDLHHNEKAWAKNRRVEFVIVKRDGM